MKNTNIWRRCTICNLYMSYKDISDGYLDYTPDTSFTHEKIEYSHKECYKKCAKYVVQKNM